MNRVYSSAVITNKISIRSNLKIGMKRGYFKEASYKNGKFLDRVAFAFLAKDFLKDMEKNKKKLEKILYLVGYYFTNIFAH